MTLDKEYRTGSNIQ